ncbi:flagellar assembly protein FliW [Paenibacillus jilunlii]|uniref:Flagellar assembly factor FliW n=1 Tax=Paenibacillus jilunlii TaxID=682956 RepID=A0A1G9VQ22_9BACL|nr:flagellar assembly protein FliW [Paenibacillus jilunlii]KWX75867.1 flagellar biosynthesis protein FliW [Paenibacillus jilunlii]SDM74236.1 flagellar assembly factor FliW [Paenibacillus jilunlii]
MTHNHVQQENTIETNALTFLFPKGLPGFEQLKKFSLKEHNDIFSLLSAVDQPEVTFITVNPFDFVPDYEFVLPQDTIQELGMKDEKHVSVRCIVTWHSDRLKVSVNLLAPLIFNTVDRKGKQIVLQNTTYTTKHPLWTGSPKTHEGGDS